MRNSLHTDRFMTFARRIVPAIALAMFAFVPVAASAQNAQGSPVTESKNYGSWTVRCYRPGTLPCDVSQSTVDRARRILIASISISYIPKSDAYFGRFVLPLGVSFDQGMGLEIGAFKAANLKFRICERDGCYVTGIVPSTLIDAMKTEGSKGTISASLIDGRKFQIPIVLDGFSDGLDALKKRAEQGDAGADKATKK
jgi:invasion protein IalB